MTLWRRPQLGSYAVQWRLLGVMLAVLAGAIGWSLDTEYKASDARERERLAAQAKVVDENLSHQLVATNRALDAIRGELPELQAKADGVLRIKRRLKMLRDAMPGTRALTIFDADGVLIARSPDQFEGQNFSTREYFQIARSGGNPTTLYVAPPFLAATGEYVTNMSKVLLDDRGRFAGVILASLDPEYFSILMDSIRYAPDMWSSLAHADGKLFLRIPAREGTEGADLAKPGSFFTRHIESGQAASVATGVGYSSGEERMVATRTIKPAGVPLDKAFVLFVSRDLQAIFSTWRQHRRESVGLLSLLAVVAVLALLSYQWRRQAYDNLLAVKEAEEKRAESEHRLAAAAFESQEAMMITDARGSILRANKAFIESTGYAAADLIGRNPRILQSGRHDAEFFRAMWDSIRRTGGWQGEIWDRRKNGEVYPKWLTISAVKGDDGTVVNYVGTHYDITERKKAEEKINELAYFDQLTGLANRTLLLDRLKQAMTASARNEAHGALLIIDLDNFKTLNDTLGHDVGDLLLKQVAQRLTTCVREGDTVARLGGDEFVVMLANLNASESDAAIGIETVADKILLTLNQTYQLRESAFHSTASIGVTVFSGQAATVDDLMKQADLAMYKAKEAGRNVFRFFDPKMESSVKERVALEADLRHALDEKQFLLHYQAQVVADGRVAGAEVLVRWQHPERGLVSPAEFIPFAEETGLILALGHWVLETACQQLAAWAAQPEMAQLTVAVNVSAHQFRQANFVELVLKVLKQTGADPNRLKLELTESLLVENAQDIIEKMHALKAKGVGFSLDDFGTGYSSLSYLKRLPLDQLKIDRSFVRDVLIDQNDAAIAKTIVALAQSLGLGVIAEGVETAAQRDFLSNSGCHSFQGYFYSRPLTLAGFEAYVRQT